MKTAKMFLLFFVIYNANSFSQNKTDEAKAFFSEYHNSKDYHNLCVASIPTLEDCRLVLKGPDCDVYYNYVKKIESSIKEESKKEIVKYATVKIQSFTSEEVKNGTANATGGMTQISEKLKSNVIFYDVKYLKKSTDEFGFSSKYWVNLNGVWVFFPHIWDAFTKNETPVDIESVSKEKMDSLFNAASVGVNPDSYFSTFKDSKDLLGNCLKSLPTLDECKLVLKSPDCLTYYQYVQKVAKSAKEEATKSNETFANSKVRSFTTEDLKKGSPIATGGMNKISGKFLNKVTFYDVKFLKKKEDDAGIKSRYWVYLNEKWIFLPHIWDAFPE